tara:strand:- start:2776 stop:3498 length:723 start_codon:yes stop_codon:yes gene_type:complete
MSKNVAIFGSSGAIGDAFSKIFTEDDSINRIYNFSRKNIQNTSEKVTNIYIDIVDENSIKKSSEEIPQDLRFDIVIVATGILHNESDIFPEKSIRDITSKQMQDVFLVNTIGPTLIGKYFIPFLNKNDRSVFAFLSARVGSISENILGGWYSYRSSKTALNQVIKNFSIEVKRSNPNAIFVGLQPGTVDSNLSSPFKKNVKSENLFSPSYSAMKLIEVISSLDLNDSGKFIAWDGEEINP